MELCDGPWPGGKREARVKCGGCGLPQRCGRPPAVFMSTLASSARTCPPATLHAATNAAAAMFPHLTPSPPAPPPPPLVLCSLDVAWNAREVSARVNAEDAPAAAPHVLAASTARRGAGAATKALRAAVRARPIPLNLADIALFSRHPGSESRLA